ncbi:FAD-binding and (Fe-S)-binding domain-containing protein [Reyranella sp.]|uniref:FAD-binding and (Fe-S)-binding domain-containing protein n=1 Tax=Reyranella sp. TaxID=1929291 RepID=UPI0012251821|nr:FAD-binding and (Fe-S)-binding domain-containing protein [Reyranella sp.]TAJ83234.1 MAG: FAD-binding oxidoreductase [Reyranella sp.]
MAEGRCGGRGETRLSTLEQNLRRTLKGEVLFDRASRGRYATDASIYQVEPVGVVVPRDETDLGLAIEVARDAKAAILPRGAGTSQCGQTVGEALVIDCSKYLREVVGFDKNKAQVTVQPGVVLDQLNAWLKPHGLWYPVDVSTSAQCTLGGMAGNNSCGSRSIRYGNMVHNVASIDAILANGERARFGSARPEDMPPSVRAIADKVAELAFAERDEIERMYPKVLRRVGGYNLDIFFPQSERPYTTDNSVNLAHLLVGSEGTLAVTERLTLKLAPLPKHKTLGVVNFTSFYKAMDSAQHIVKLKPAAVELVDRTMIELARANPAFRPVIERALIGKPEAILLVEFAGEEREDQLRDLARLVELMADLGLPGSVVEMPEPGPQAALWEVRKAGLNIMMSMKGDGKPVSFIEDCAVPLEHLADYTQRLTDVFEKHGTKGTWYAHASVGTLHVRPILDMRREGATKMRAIAEEASALVREYKGAYSGEHGDGLVRSEWVGWQFGPRLTKAFETVKDLFDPQGILNPGKIVRPSRMDDRSLFRFKPGYTGINYTPALDWSAWNVQNDPRTEELTEPGSGGDSTGGFAKAAEMCNNNGHCRKFDAGTMCPSFRVTRDEKHLTRGRANTLRLALSGQLGPEALRSDYVAAAMDLCVSCKGCKRDCPTGVDMARMKIEVKSARSMARGLSWRDRMIGAVPSMAPWARRLPWLFNAAWFFQTYLGFAKQRRLPQWRSDTFLTTTEVDDRDATVVIFADTFSNNFEPEILHAARQVLTAAGHKVAVAWPTLGAPALCCGRTYLSTGQVERARSEARRLLNALRPFAIKGVPIIGLEPSCLFTLRDEFLAMNLGEDAKAVADNAVLFEEFLAREKREGRLTLDLKPLQEKTALLHGHCHQKAFGAMSAVQEVLGLVPDLKVTPIESSCCGMAGSFGYEAEHYETSMAMAELSLLPAVRKADADTLVVADGTSCRHQIADGADRQALHVAQVLASALD